MQKIRTIKFFKSYFMDFYISLPKNVRDKINYSLYMVETQLVIPTKFFKQIKASNGLFENRTEFAGNIYRIFCCMDSGSIVILFNGFQKKTQKTPKNEIEIAERLKEEYFKSKEN